MNETTNYSHYNQELESQYKKYVGTNYEYYEKSFAKIQETNSNKFNLAAFFLNIPWLFYRKLYIEGIIATILSCLAYITPSLLYAFVMMSDTYNTFDFGVRFLLRGIVWFVSMVLVISVFLIIGFWGNKLYLKKITKLKNKNKDYKCGGTSVASAITFPIAIIFVGMVLIKLFI